MVGKVKRFTTIHINQAVCTKLTWMADHVRSLPGICILSASAWSPASLTPGSLGDEFVMTDVSAWGLGLYFPWHNIGFYSLTPDSIPTDGTFSPKSLTICSTIHKVRAWHSADCHIKRIAVLSDSFNAVSIFRTLRATPVYNPILMSAVDVLIANEMEHRIDHVPGECNVVADALSHSRSDLVHTLHPGPIPLHILPFTPPSNALSLLHR